MDILIIIGESIDVSSSTNVFKKRIIKDLSKNNNVTVLMDNDSTKINNTYSYTKDKVNYITVSRVLRLERYIKLIKNRSIKSVEINSDNKDKKIVNTKQMNVKNKIYAKHIDVFYKKYRYNSKWLDRIKKLKINKSFDLVISISHPPAAHKAADVIIKNKSIVAKKWIQIWFEPWFQIPTKKNKTKLVIKEESNLLKEADDILYVNPLFFKHQQQIFNNYQKKMKCISLPVENVEQIANHIERTTERIEIAYTGNYYSNIRNIEPFYQAISKMDYITTYIIGDSDVSLTSSENVIIKSRVDYTTIKSYEDKVDILIVLCNKSLQIPGKIYDYSSSNKYILVILDGEETVKKELYNYFSKFNRYIFCENNELDIKMKIDSIINGQYTDVNNKPIDEFQVKYLTEKLFNLCNRNNERRG